MISAKWLREKFEGKDGSAPAAEKPARRAASGLKIAAFVVAVAAAGVLANRTWQWHQLPARMLAALPQKPDTGTFPPELDQRLAEAAAKVHRRSTAFDGAAELGRLYHANGFHDEAEACWRLLIAEQPGEARWPYYLADLRRMASDHQASDELLRRTTRLAPGYTRAWLRMADQEFKTGRLDAARDHYGRRLGLLPGDPYARLGLARIALQTGDRNDARQQIETIVDTTPNFPPAQNLFAEMLAAAGEDSRAAKHRWKGREAGRFREADDPWLEELNDSCLDPNRLQVLGAIAWQTDKRDRALELVERATRLGPGDPRNYSFLGDLLLKLGRSEEARVVLEKGLAIDGTPPPAVMHHVNLALAWRTLKKPREAERVVRAAIARLGDSFELFDALGMALGDQKRFEAAVDAFQHALAENPNDSNANFNLAAVLLDLGRVVEARMYLERSLVAQPTFPQALLYLGRLESDAGNLEAAAKYLRPLFESHPEQTQPGRLLAAVLLRSGKAAAEKKDLTGAEKYFREALEIDPDNAELHASLGVQLLVEGRVDESIPSLEAYRRLDRENSQSSLFLGQAYARMNRFGDARRILEEGTTIAEKAGNAATADFCREILRQLP